jgi:hypothetical protein
VHQTDRLEAAMNIPWGHILFWTPRALAIAFAGFLALFALDVFNEGYGPWKTLLALAIHLVPTLLVLGAAAVSWRWGWLGAPLFLGLAAYYVVMTRGHMRLSVYALIAGPLVLIGLLFLADWWHRSRTVPAP